MQRIRSSIPRFLFANTKRTLFRTVQQCRLRVLHRGLASRGAAMKISEADRDAYQRDGVVCLRNVFAKEWLDLLRKSTEVASPPCNP
eukprot:3041064-Rhodomonas_salina.2